MRRAWQEASQGDTDGNSFGDIEVICAGGGEGKQNKGLGSSAMSLLQAGRALTDRTTNTRDTCATAPPPHQLSQTPLSHFSRLTTGKQTEWEQLNGWENSGPGDFDR